MRRHASSTSRSRAPSAGLRCRRRRGAGVPVEVDPVGGQPPPCTPQRPQARAPVVPGLASRPAANSPVSTLVSGQRAAGCACCAPRRSSRMTSRSSRNGTFFLDRRPAPVLPQARRPWTAPGPPRARPSASEDYHRETDGARALNATAFGHDEDPAVDALAWRRSRQGTGPLVARNRSRWRWLPR